MTSQQTDTVVVGAGQAGIAMSEHLSKNQIEHLVLERNRIAERWRTCRWDSLVANGPAWHDRFPGMEFSCPADGFADKESVAKYFEDYATRINAPVRCGVEVTSVKRRQGQPGFEVETSEGLIIASNVVAATGPFQKPVIPAIVPETEGLLQIHSADYRNPGQLPAGAVMVVGAGSSGVQIADELQRSGRQVYLSVGPHDRPPRAYRGRDFCWWLGVLGKWDLATMEPGKEHVTIAVTGSHGGFTIDFRQLAHQGMVLTGRTNAYANGNLQFGSDLRDNINSGDQNYLEVLREADAYVERYGLDLPEEPQAYDIPADPDCLVNPLQELNLQQADIHTIIWATGYALDFSWLKVDCFDERGTPIHQRGVSKEPGIYFLGLPWLSRRGSSFIWGVWHDAKFIADHINMLRRYRDYQPVATSNADTLTP